MRHRTDDPQTVSSMPAEQAVVVCKEEAGSGGSKTSPHRKHSPYAAPHRRPADGVIHASGADRCQMQRGVRLGRE